MEIFNRIKNIMKDHQEEVYNREDLLFNIYRDVFGEGTELSINDANYAAGFICYIVHGISNAVLIKDLGRFDLIKISKGLVKSRDKDLSAERILNLYQHRLIRNDLKILETPQFLWMRISMGFMLDKNNTSTDDAINYYNVLSANYNSCSEEELFSKGSYRSLFSGPVDRAGLNKLDINIEEVRTDENYLSKIKTIKPKFDSNN